MREITINQNDAGQRLDRFVSKALPLLPPALLQKYIRLKRIKVNGKGSARDTRLQPGDRLQLYIKDEFFDAPAPENAFLRLYQPKLDIVYEDENILLADKRPGISVHPDETEQYNTLLTHIQAYLYQKGEWDPRREHSFAPALCNRIDRNTGGIVIAAKNADALRILNQKIRDREIKKYYLCIVHGKPSPAEGRLEGFLRKDEAKKQVTVSRKPLPGAKSAATLYRTLRTSGSLSLLECELITGRTHQIRAQLAAAGHPLLGDGKYGRESENKKYGRKFQALYSYKLVFSFRTPAGELEYLSGRAYQVKRVDFAEEYFPCWEGKDFCRP